MTLSSSLYSPSGHPQHLGMAIWQKTSILIVLAFWLSGTVLMDAVMMPVLYTSGMLQSPSFGPVGYALFWVFNRIELLCAGLVLAGVLAVRSLESWRTRLSLRVVLLAAGLGLIALAETFGLTPAMSALAAHLTLSSGDVPPSMNTLHLGYWVLDSLKLLAGAGILYSVYRAIRFP
jgi:hypothetical protein